MRLLKISVVLLLIVMCTGTSWGTGYCNWWSYWYASTTNLWPWACSACDWGYFPNSYASAYAADDGYVDAHTVWGWNASTQAHADPYEPPVGHPEANAYADAYNGYWGYWCGPYVNARVSVTDTDGDHDDYARAYAYSDVWCWHQYSVPWVWWQDWRIYHGPYIPYWCNWWYWGWIDDAPDVGIGAQETLIDNNANTSTQLFSNWAQANPGGTLTLGGATTWSPGDFVFGTDVNPDVAGDQPGYNIVGHDPNTSGDTPLLVGFSALGVDLGLDPLNPDNHLIGTSLRCETALDTAAPTPEPCSALLLLASVPTAAWIRRRRRRPA